MFDKPFNRDCIDRSSRNDALAQVLEDSQSQITNARDWEEEGNYVRAALCYANAHNTLSRYTERHADETDNIGPHLRDIETAMANNLERLRLEMAGDTEISTHKINVAELSEAMLAGSS